jgi:hypothetical protein
MGMGGEALLAEGVKTLAEFAQTIRQGLAGGEIGEREGIETV